MAADGSSSTHGIIESARKLITIVDDGEDDGERAAASGGGKQDDVRSDTVVDASKEETEGKRLEITAEEPSEGSEEPSDVVLRTTLWVPSTLKDRDVQESWHKWNLDELVRFYQISTTRRVSEDVFEEIFNSSKFREVFLPVVKSKTGVRLSGTVTKVRVRPLRVSQTSMSFFDRLESKEDVVVPGSGYIRKCADIVVDGATFQDELRDCIGNPDSEKAYIWDDDDRDELLFELMRLITVGGSMCQWDDDWNTYLQVVKSLYKDLVRVERNPATGDIQVKSKAWSIQDLKSADPKLFPLHNTHNQCILIADPTTTSATLLYAPFIPFW